MTEPEVTCPTLQQLKALIQSSLSDDQQAAIQTHVDNCAECQKQLELLVTGSESWDAAIDHLRAAQPEPEDTMLSDAIKKMKSEDDSQVGGPASSTALDLLTPSDHPGSIGRLGTYEVSEVVGQGGMGVVLKAFDPSLHRVVAVKVLAPHLAHNPNARKRFIREAQAIAAVSHDHVITIHAIDESESQPKIVMHYVSGQSLQQKIDSQGSLDLKEILRIGMQTASGLAAAHAQGLVHRDVKPSNILLENGVQRVRLTDFGLARAVDDASLTQSGVIAGTPQYMAPEQANGDEVDFRADLFSLGSVLYAMCVGHSPFRASTTMGVLKRVCHDSPRPIQEVNPDIPEWLCNIIMKLLAKRPEDRFPNAKTVADLLEKWLAHVQQPNIVARPGELKFDTRLTSAEIPRRSSESPAQTSDAATADDEIYERTILFQPISGRMFVFLTLTGMALTLVWVRLAYRNADPLETLIFSIVPGLAFCMAGSLCISLYRFVRANLSGQRSDRLHAMRRSKSMIAPESIAMLCGIGLMVISGNILIAAIGAIIAWRVLQWQSKQLMSLKAAAADVSETAPQSTVDSPSESRVGRLAHKLLELGRGSIRQIIAFLRRAFDFSNDSRNRTLLSIAWFFSGAIDVLGAMLLFLGSVLAGLLFVVMSILSIAAAHCLAAQQNISFLRMMSYVGLLPVTPGALIRIPTSILTLVWLGSPEIENSFDKSPWPQTLLGRIVNGAISFTRRSTATLAILGVWAIGFPFLLFLMLYILVVPYFPSEYRVYDETRATVRDVKPPVNIRVSSFGMGHLLGLRHPTSSYRRQSVKLRVQGPAGVQILPMTLGQFPVNAATGQPITLQDIEKCLTGMPEEQLTPAAANLFEVVNTLNRLATAPAHFVPLRSLTFQEASTTFGDAMHRGLEPGNQEDSAFADDRVTNVSEVVMHSHYATPYDFQTIGSMLDTRIFNVSANPSWTSAGCMIPAAYSMAAGLICFLIWLGTALLIVYRRHFSHRVKSVVVSPVPA